MKLVVIGHTAAIRKHGGINIAPWWEQLGK